jgi:Na+/glutamate symporter
VHLYLAIFWLVLGVIGQFYWDTLREHMYIPVERATFGLIFVVLFGYNFFRWRMERMAKRTVTENTEPPPRPHVREEYNPELDFTDAKDDDKSSAP